MGACFTRSPAHLHAFNHSWPHTLHRPVSGTNEGAAFNKRIELFFSLRLGLTAEPQAGFAMSLLL